MLTCFLRIEEVSLDLRAKPSYVGQGSPFIQFAGSFIHSFIYSTSVSHSEWMLSWLRTEKGQVSIF